MFTQKNRNNLLHDGVARLSGCFGTLPGNLNCHRVFTLGSSSQDLWSNINISNACSELNRSVTSKLWQKGCLGRLGFMVNALSPSAAGLGAGSAAGAGAAAGPGPGSTAADGLALVGREPILRGMIGVWLNAYGIKMGEANSRLVCPPLWKQEKKRAFVGGAEAVAGGAGLYIGRAAARPSRGRAGVARTFRISTVLYRVASAPQAQAMDQEAQEAQLIVHLSEAFNKDEVWQLAAAEALSKATNLERVLIRGSTAAKQLKLVDVLIRKTSAAGLGAGSAAGAVALADLQRKVSKMESVMPFLVSKVLLWRDGSTATHSKKEKDFKTSALKSQLQCAGVKGCQLLGEGIPPNCVSLAHLCKLSWADGTCRLLGLSKEDVSSPRNALLLSERVPTSDYHALQRVPPALQPNSQACGTVCAHSQLMETGRSFPDACALNCQLPLARLPTITNCPCAPLQSGSFRAGPPYNYLLTLAQLPTATLPPVRHLTRPWVAACPSSEARHHAPTRPFAATAVLGTW
ncbi:hypothetical protein VOLCADRAFT_97267 [Volvox carteri f. nagariensis]|uniref:Uncharacterized protein n=1 Tax=Volvox carteri f. nagariensis TaxID=3068 RepID=D8UCA7_VOLCA|nr:uncharacterized protein VOLCADRAFT_97267 [Volvox carteri f. nagariensis]EFJ42665.1 hypothetical protein VOLCADRAFT_97267 [Volvox carteri f. nagariensis]|eukprot:XP_002956316.1 hypothetical protein VOLCADRAFT_97267 [Volvox carteri f. nagariensis]